MLGLAPEWTHTRTRAHNDMGPAAPPADAAAPQHRLLTARGVVVGVTLGVLAWMILGLLLWLLF